MDPALRTCSECVLECNDASCNGDIDDHCTDQCVIVACDGDVPCSESSCKSPCEDPNNCPLPWNSCSVCNTIHHQDISCAQDSCSLACGSACEDPENCPLADITEHNPPHSSQVLTEQTYPPHTHSVDWDAALEAFLCSCGDAFPLRDGLAYNNVSRDSFTGSSPTLSTVPSPSENNSLSSALSMPLQPVVYPTPLHITPSTAPIAPTKHCCLWNGCRSSFSSLPELISHVNLSHLSVYSSEPPEPLLAPSSYIRLNSNNNFGLSCQWDNCHEYSAAVNPSGDPAFDDALSSLTGHLLQDHFGLQGAPEEHNAVTTDASIADAIVSVPEPTSGHDVEMRDEGQSFQNKRQSMALGENTNQSHSNNWHGMQDKIPSLVMNGPEKCQWGGCELSFATIDDLMQHLTVEHVGSGKNHYECFWKGCERSGKNGFTSKQKVCRHLQMHTGHKPFRCELCNQHFSEAATLQQHKRRHTHEKPYVCDVPGCGKTFAIAGALTIHRRTHMGLKPFKCKYCDRAFSESSNLSKHMRTHTGVRPYVCTEPGCGKSFARPDQFSRHQRVHLKRNRATKPVDDDYDDKNSQCLQPLSSNCQ